MEALLAFGLNGFLYQIFQVVQLFIVVLYLNLDQGFESIAKNANQVGFIQDRFIKFQ